MNFAGETILVTGGGSGIGAAVATAFASCGAKTVIVDLKLAEAEDTAAALRERGHIAIARCVDVTDAAALSECVHAIEKECGGIKHVVACAGIASRHTIPQMGAEDWRRVVDVNLTGSFLAIKATEAAIAARGGGSITLISSVAAEHVAYFSGVHYAASKTGQVGLVRHAAFELGRKGIRVNAVGPGPMSNRMGGGAFSDERQKAMSRDIPLQHIVKPEDIANVCLFLASPLARAVTGVYLPVDCGFLTSRGQPYRTYFDLHDEAF